MRWNNSFAHKANKPIFIRVVSPKSFAVAA